MAYQYKQPCLPPPSCPMEAGVPQCPASSASYQAKQPCVLPPNCPQPCVSEAVMTYAAPACPSPCTTAPSVEMRSAPGGSPIQPTAFVAEVAGAPASATVYSGATAEAVSVPSAEPMLSYVTPGSTVRLNPSGSLSVEPGAPVSAGSVFVESYTPHFL